MPHPELSTDSPGVDTVIGKVAVILRSFRSDDRLLSLAELTRRTRLPKATAYRLANDMVSVKLLDRAPGGYRLSSALFELGMRASAERSLLELAMPFLQDLYERTHETVHLGVREGHDVIYVAKIGGHRQAASPSRPGGRMPLHCTAIGKALLAHADPALRREVLTGPLERRTAHTVVAPGLLDKQLKAVAETGVSYEREESALGIACVASPVFDREGLVAAISITGPANRFRPEAHAAAVQAAAQALGNLLSRR